MRIEKRRGRQKEKMEEGKEDRRRAGREAGEGGKIERS